MAGMPVSQLMSTIKSSNAIPVTQHRYLAESTVGATITDHFTWFIKTTNKLMVLSSSHRRELQKVDYG